MAWIESHQSLLTHWKTGKLARLLGVSRVTAVGHLHVLWWWCLDNAPEGDLSGIDPEEVAAGAGWEGDPIAFCDALLAAEFIDQHDRGSMIHDWHDYAGKLVDKRRANAERMRAARAATKPPPMNDRASHVQNTLHARAGATVPNPTVPNRTEPNPTGVPESGGDANAADATAPPPKKSSRASKPKGSDADLERIRQAFVASGMRAPALVAPDEVRAAHQLLARARSPDDFPAYWQDVRAGRYGDTWDQRNLNFVTLNRNERYENWVAWKEGEVVEPQQRVNGRTAGAARDFPPALGKPSPFAKYG